MEREKLIAQINSILFDPYFPLQEREKWLALIPKMSNEDLKELLENLKLKTKALFEIDITLYKLGKTCEANLDIDEEIDKEAKKYPLQDLTPENLVLLFNKNLSPWLEKDFDIKSDIEAYLSFDVDLVDLRKKLINALTTNKELIGEKNITTLTGKKLEPTISNWLKDYEERIADKPNHILAKAEYLTNSPNILQVSSKDKEKIKKLIEVYDLLKYPSTLFPSPGITFPSGVVTPPTTSPPVVSSVTPIEKKPEGTELEEKPEKKLPPKPSEPKSPLEEKYLEEEKKES